MRPNLVPHTGIAANVRWSPAEYGCYGGLRPAPMDSGRLEGTDEGTNAVAVALWPIDQSSRIPCALGTAERLEDDAEAHLRATGAALHSGPRDAYAVCGRPLISSMASGRLSERTTTRVSATGTRYAVSLV